MSEPFSYPERPWDRGKVLTDRELAELSKFERYRDVDGDGIPFRTLPGSRDPKGVYFTRGSGHNEAAQYSEKPEDYRRGMDRLARKLETARTLVPRPVVEEARDAEVGVIAYGSTHWAMVEARDQLRAAGLPTGYLLLKALPFTDDVRRFIRQHRRVYVVEQNRDGQVFDLVRLEADAAEVARLRSVRHYNGLPVDARSITDAILGLERAGDGVVAVAADDTHRPAVGIVAEGVTR